MTTSTTPRTITPTTAAIDMYTPRQACRRLRVDERTLIAMVNSGRVPAYDLGGSIRFKATDIAARSPRSVHDRVA